MKQSGGLLWWKQEKKLGFHKKLARIRRRASIPHGCHLKLLFGPGSVSQLNPDPQPQEALVGRAG